MSNKGECRPNGIFKGVVFGGSYPIASPKGGYIPSFLRNASGYPAPLKRMIWFSIHFFPVCLMIPLAHAQVSQVEHSPHSSSVTTPIAPATSAATTSGKKVSDGYSTRLATVSVTGRAPLLTNRAYVAGPTSISTGLPLTPFETPQSVTVITRKQMNDQNMETLQDVLSNASGITSSSQDNGGRTTYRARGFNITNFKVDGLQFNGVSGLSGTGNTLNMDLYDNVQVVQGANGLLGGTGDPSATIDLQRKRPGYIPQAKISYTGGSWNKRHTMLDVSTPLNAERTVRARTVLSYDDSDTFRNNEKEKRFGGLFNVVANPTTSTTVNMGIQQENDRHDGATWGADVPIWYADGTRTHLSRKTNKTADWSFLSQRATTLFFNIDQKLNDNWKLHTSYAHIHSTYFTNLGEAKVNNITKKRFGGFWNRDGSGAALNALHSEGKANRDALDISASGPFHIFNRRNDFTIGFNGYNDVETDYSFGPDYGNCQIGDVSPYSAKSCQYRATGLPYTSWRNWDNSFYPNFSAQRTDAREVTHIENYGLYAATRLTLLKPLKLILGGRFSNYRTFTTTYDQHDTRTRSPHTSYHGQFTPYAGLVWTVNPNNMLYASYTNVFDPQDAHVDDAQGNLLSPTKGNSYETGWKTSLFHNRLNTELSYFRNKQNNVAVDTGTPNPNTPYNIYRSASGVKAHGVEAEVMGQLTPNWNLYAGYTYLSESGLGFRQDPRHQFHLFTTYRLPGALHRLTIGGGVSAQSSREWQTNPGRPMGNGKYDKSNLKTKGYALVDLMAHYDISHNWEAGLNVTNLTDKTYYQQFGFYDGLLYGQPRSVTVNVSFHF